jgi:probable F420-dependent oxidoreductase
MRIGIFAPLASPIATASYVRALAEGAEQRNFHSIWLGEHVVLFDDYSSRYPYSPDGRIPAGGENGLLDPLAALGFLAAATRRIRIGTAVVLVPQRNPVYTAKEIATLDVLSGGRVDFGVGVGWLAEEFKALGVPFERRGSRCREYLRLMQALWRDPVSQFRGDFYELPACRQFPKPVQKPHPPIHFGGESDAALRRVAELGQGWHPFHQEPQFLAQRIATLEKMLNERGRKRSQIEVTICSYLRPISLDLVKRYRDAGADQVTVMPLAGDVPGLEKALDALASQIVLPAEAL